eukprot:768724-Hanusia_phi.AAC.3
MARSDLLTGLQELLLDPSLLDHSDYEPSVPCSHQVRPISVGRHGGEDRPEALGHELLAVAPKFLPDGTEARLNLLLLLQGAGSEPGNLVSHAPGVELELLAEDADDREVARDELVHDSDQHGLGDSCHTGPQAEEARVEEPRMLLLRHEHDVHLLPQAHLERACFLQRAHTCQREDGRAAEAAALGEEGVGDEAETSGERRGRRGAILRADPAVETRVEQDGDDCGMNSCA